MKRNNFFTILLTLFLVSQAWGQSNALDHINRGNNFLDEEKWDMAIREFDQALRLDPNNATAYGGRGDAYGGKGEWDKAIADFETTLRLDPNHPHAKRNIDEAARRRPSDDDFAVLQNRDNTLTITGYKGSAADIVIPATLYGLKVTRKVYKSLAAMHSIITK